MNNTNNDLKSIAKSLQNLAQQISQLANSLSQSPDNDEQPASTTNLLAKAKYFNTQNYNQNSLPKPGIAYRWSGENGLVPNHKAKAIPLHLLHSVDRQKSRLVKNTENFCKGLAANNALLWGARGTGKSALIKSVWFDAVSKAHGAYSSQLISENNANSRQTGDFSTISPPALVYVSAAEIDNLSKLFDQLASGNNNGHNSTNSIIFLDDFSIGNSSKQKAVLKSALQGGIGEQPQCAIIYATSNQRHILHRPSDTDLANEMFPADHLNDQVALSDRFGISLSFSSLSEQDYIDIILTYLKHLQKFNPKFNYNKSDVIKQAKTWARSRGSLSGRAAWQYLVEFAGENDLNINLIFDEISENLNQ